MTFKKLSLSILIISIVIAFLCFMVLSRKNERPNTCKILGIDHINKLNFEKFDSVVVSASSFYKADEAKTFLQGKNYRESWSVPVKAPVLFLDTLYGGMEVSEEGGGKQTKSLIIKSKDNLVMTLRSINKNPDALVPETLNTLGLENVIKDGISGQHPYATVVVAKLADKLGILHTHPKLVFLPKQVALGKSYNENYGNKLYWLEYEDKGNYNWTAHYNFIEILDTDNLQELRLEKGDNVAIDKDALIKARLFDLLIGDWDRHAKQWGWVLIQNDGIFKAIPFPMDRDNAFFAIDGIIPAILSTDIITPHLQSFEKDVQNMEGLVYDFDVYFLQHTTEEQFIDIAKTIQNELSDSEIELAFRTSWNKELYQLDASELIEIIKSRRDNLIQLAKEFKAILDTRSLLQEPLKGSDFDDTGKTLLPCFEC